MSSLEMGHAEEAIYFLRQKRQVAPVWTVIT